MSFVLTGLDLSIAQVVRVAREGELVELAPEAIERMREARGIVDEAIARGDAIYGVTTGVASRKRVTVGREEVAEFNRRLLRSHRVGQGAPASDDVVRAQMLRMTNGFASGRTGVRHEIAERFVRALNDGETPRVRLLGS